MAHKDTQEQKAFYAALATLEDILAEAGAGCGKTTVLKGGAKRQRKRKFLYIAYNRAIKDEAKATFPRNAHCMTAAGMAFMPVTKTMEHKLNNAPRMYAEQAARILGTMDTLIKVGEVGGEDVIIGGNRLAAIIMQAVMNFCYSADENISRKHVPLITGADTEGMAELSTIVVPIARRAYFEDLIEPNGRLGWNKSHDYALKWYCLSRPDLSNRYDCILFDEAQDANPAVADLIERQACQKVFVGDRNQAIYAWRGAQDAMQGFDAKHRLTLSQSFRFGQAVADEANKWLTLLEAPLRLTGFDEIHSEVGPLEEYDAALCRTNVGVLVEAMAVREAGKSYAVVGGTDEIKRFAEAAASLQRGIKTDHPDLAGFKNWDQLRVLVNQDKTASDLKIFVNLIDQYGVPTIMQLANEAVDDRTGLQQVTISTSHKAKGREWKRVKIGPDFTPPEPDPKTGEIKLDRGEMMLAYVAVTRGQERVDVGSLDWVNLFLPQGNTNEPDYQGVSDDPDADTGEFERSLGRADFLDEAIEEAEQSRKRTLRDIILERRAKEGT